jgi:hypothetical protein
MPLTQRNLKNNPTSDQRKAGIIPGNRLNHLCAWRGWFLPEASAHVSEYSGLHSASLDAKQSYIKLIIIQAMRNLLK